MTSGAGEDIRISPGLIDARSELGNRQRALGVREDVLSHELPDLRELTE